MGRLDGKVAIVTGAGQGLGRAYAEALVVEGAKLFDGMFGDEEAAKAAFPVESVAAVLVALVCEECPCPSGTVLLAAGKLIKELRVMASVPIESEDAQGWTTEDVLARLSEGPLICERVPAGDTSFPV